MIKQRSQLNDARHQLYSNTNFQIFSTAQLEQLAQSANLVHLFGGNQLFQTGDKATHFYCISTGMLKLSRLSTEGHEKVLDIPGPGDIVALASVFLPEQTHTYLATALTDCEILAIPDAALLEVLNSDAPLCIKLLSQLSHQVQNRIEEIDSICLKTAANRFAAYLLSNTTSNQKDCHSSRPTAVFKFPASKSVIASRLAITPETLSRLLRSLSKQQVIESKGNQIIIRNLGYLHELSNGANALKWY
ncbi:MAG: Crp/Fnr family transcriptional regulator [Chromatiales bacterium]|nr:Crp/Fnr family transcriptional regulator [Chromatiales bacterium]